MAETMVAGVSQIQGPAWDLSDEYPAPDSSEIVADLGEPAAKGGGVARVVLCHPAPSASPRDLVREDREQ